MQERKYITDVVKYEIYEYSRDDATIAPNTSNLSIGTVLGEGSDGKYAPLKLDDTNGLQIARAVLLENLAPNTSDTNSIILARHGVITTSNLTFPDAITDEQRKNALKELETYGIITRKEG